MRYFKTQTGEIRAIDHDQGFLIDPIWVEISEGEAVKPDDPALLEQSWVISEMSIADIEVNKHDDGDARAIATKTKWQAYRCQLRDYVKGGQIVGERPQRPV